GEIQSESELSIDRLVRAVDASRVAPHPVGNHASVLVEVIDGRAITGVGGAAGEREVVIDGGGSSKELVFPVRVRRSQGGERGGRQNAEGNLLLNESAVRVAAEDVEVLPGRRSANLELVFH